MFLLDRELQENLVRSHSAGDTSHFFFSQPFEATWCVEVRVVLWYHVLGCVGVGNPLSPERTRMLLALRINVLAKGHSGISLETLQAMIQAFNGRSSFMHNPGIDTEEEEGLILSPNRFCPGSILPVLRPREGNRGRQRRPGPPVSPGPGANGRGQNVVPQERLGRRKICKLCSEQTPPPPGSVFLLTRNYFQRFQSLTRSVCFVWIPGLSRVCLLSSLSRSWRPMDLDQ